MGSLGWYSDYSSSIRRTAWMHLLEKVHLGQLDTRTLGPSDSDLIIEQIKNHYSSKAGHGMFAS